MRKIIPILGSSIATYLIVAACSSPSGNKMVRTIFDGGVYSDVNVVTPNNKVDADIVDAFTDVNSFDSNNGVDIEDSGRADVFDALFPGDAKAQTEANCECDSFNDSGSRLRRYFLVAEDGTKQPFYQYYDAELDIKCNFTKNTYTDNYHCAPLFSAQASYFSDPNCTNPVILGSYEWVFTDSQYMKNYGNEYVGEVYIKDEDNLCTNTNINDSLEFYTTGRTINIKDLVSVELKFE